MSEQVAQTAQVKPKIAPMQVYIEGKITRQRRHERKFYTIITAAAADVYSMPAMIEVRSDEQLGQEGDVVKIICRVSGFVRQFDYTERGTGIRKKGDDFVAIFDVIAG